MIPIYRQRWFYRMVRANTSQIPEDVARKWKARLACAYLFSALSMFYFGRKAYSRDKKYKEETYGDVDQTYYWLQKVGHENATIYKISGTDFTSVKVEGYDVQKAREEEEEAAAKAHQLLSSTTDSKVRDDNHLDTVA